MTYRFHSKAAGDVLMLQPDGDKVLTAMGLAPAPRGLLQSDAMPVLIGAIAAAVEREESLPAASRTDADRTAPGSPDPGEISLRQRSWPLVEMMKRAHAEGEPIVWGV
jgi:hypothetical protein